MIETIMMIHGMCGNGEWYWENYKKFFKEKGYYCVSPTLRFHNMSLKEIPDSRLGTTSILDYVEDLEKEIRKLDTIPILMGHSMGGLLAQILGSKGFAKAIVLLSPASPRGIIALKLSVIRAFLSVFTKWGFWKKPFRLTFNEIARSALHLLSIKEQKEVFNKFVYESGRAAYEIGFWFFDLKKVTKVNESKITCPILIVAGTLDKITPASIARKIANKYKNVSTYKEFTNHTHWIIGDPGWQEVAEYIFGWLNKVLDKNK